MNKRQEPRLRFQGFTGAWEEKKVIDFSPLQRGFDLPVSKINEGDYPVVFSNGILKSHNQYKVKGVGIVTGRSGTIGEVTFVEKDFWPHNTALWVTNFFSNNPQFVFYFLKNFDLSRFATGSGVPTLNRNDVHNQTIYVPKFEEQTAIGNFFRRLDSQIAESRAVLEKSRQLKKAMLAKMFPANGEKIPKIRFKGFEGEWECRKLGEIGELYQPRTITGTDLTFTGYPVFGANGYIGFYGEANHFEDQVTISARGEGTGTANYVTAPVWITGNSMVINVDCNNEIDKKFLFALLTAMSLKKYVTGGAQPQLTREVLEKISLKIPTLPEQTAIGNFFRQLDETIALQSAEVEKLNQIKKGLLAAMLV